MTSKMSIPEIEQFLTRFSKRRFGEIVETGPMQAKMVLPFNDAYLRSGGSINGPTQMALADICMYVAILAQIGPSEKAFTTSLNMNFYRRPKPEDLTAQARILKLGTRLVVGDVLLFSGADEASVSHASLTYSVSETN